jgi:hypothetical protein
MDGASRLDHAHGPLRQRARHERLDGHRPLAVRADAGRRRVRRAGAAGRRLHDRRHERSVLGARAGRRGGTPPRRRPRGRRCRDEDVHEPARRPRASRGARRRRGCAIRGRPAPGSRAARRPHPGAGAARAPYRASVRIRRPDVRDGSGHGIRDCARDRPQAPRDVPDRGRAAHGDRPRSRPDRSARRSLSRCG